MDFGVGPQDKTPKSGVAHCKLSPSQESENEQIRNQIDVHLFFFLTVRGSSTRNVCHQDKLSIKLSIGKSYVYMSYKTLNGKMNELGDEEINQI